MLYPAHDSALIQTWQFTVDVLHESSAAEYSLLRIAYPSRLEIVAASPDIDGSLRIGQRDYRENNHYCEEVLRQRTTVSVQDAAQDARWDGCEERRAGYGAYCGAPLLWPDDEAFGTLAMLKKTAFSDQQLQRQEQHFAG
jgi:GAF domain-containing protein